MHGHVWADQSQLLAHSALPHLSKAGGWHASRPGRQGRGPPWLAHPLSLCLPQWVGVMLEGVGSLKIILPWKQPWFAAAMHLNLEPSSMCLLFLVFHTIGQTYPYELSIKHCCIHWDLLSGKQGTLMDCHLFSSTQVSWITTLPNIMETVLECFCRAEN